LAAQAQDPTSATTNRGLRAWHYGAWEIKGRHHKVVVQSPNFRLTPEDKGKFSGSVAAPTVDLTTLAAIAQAPAEEQWTDLSVPNQGVFRYLKYDGPKGSYAAIAEVEFYHG
jgi:hypothetical protein